MKFLLLFLMIPLIFSMEIPGSKNTNVYQKPLHLFMIRDLLRDNIDKYRFDRLTTRSAELLIEAINSILQDMHAQTFLMSSLLINRTELIVKLVKIRTAFERMLN